MFCLSDVAKTWIVQIFCYFRLSLFGVEPPGFMFEQAVDPVVCRLFPVLRVFSLFGFPIFETIKEKETFGFPGW